MRFRILVFFFGALALSWGALDAQAGVLRYAGKQISKGSTAVAQTTTNAAGAAGGSVAAAGKASTGVVKTGVVSVGKGTKAAAKGVWKAIW
jgi:hypothetical protein